MAVSVARRLFTVTEYERLGEAGVLNEDDRVELIEGEILTMSPIGSPHAACVNRLNAALTRILGQTAIVSVQNPIRLSEYSEPQPDIALLRPRADFYASGHPTPADVLLIMEVAESSLAYDRDLKIPAYAQAGIPEVWLWDLEDGVVSRYSRLLNGKDRDVQRAQRGESLTSTVIPNLTLSIDHILG